MSGAGALRALGLSVAVAACYANSLDVPFLMDDFRPWETLDYRTRPLVWATFDLNRWLTGAETWSYHVVNALVHLASGFLLFGILRRILARAVPGVGAGTGAGLAYVTTLVWLCHPLQTATVTYLSQRAEAMGALFYLAAFYSFLRAADGARPLVWQALTLVALALGFASKEIIATAPALFLLYDALFLATGILAALRARPGFYGAMAFTSLVLAWFYIAPLLLSDPLVSTSGLKLAAFGPLDYARTQPGVILHYLRLVIWPHPLCFDPGWPIARAPLEWLPQTAVLVALLAATVVLCVRRSWTGLALASFFLVLAPTSSFVPIQDPAFEHRMYLPLAAVLAPVLVAGWRLATRASLAHLLPALSVALVLLLAGLSVLRNQDYRSPVRLWQETVEQAPHHARAHDSLGGALLDAGRTEEAIEELLEALRLDPKAGYVYMNLGIAYMRLEQVDRAIPFFERAAGRGDPQAASALGNALALKGDHDGAAAWLAEAVRLHPDNARIQYRYAEALERSGQPEEAAQRFEVAARLDPELQRVPVEKTLAIPPDSPQEHFNLGVTLRSLGRFDEAMAAFREAIRLSPDVPEPCSAFAKTACMKPDATPEERREALRMALRANRLTRSRRPDILEVCAQAHAALGDYRSAVEMIDKSLKLPGPARNEVFANRLRALRAEYGSKAGE